MDDLDLGMLPLKKFSCPRYTCMSNVKHSNKGCSCFRSIDPSQLCRFCYCWVSISKSRLTTEPTEPTLAGDGVGDIGEGVPVERFQLVCSGDGADGGLGCWEAVIALCNTNIDIIYSETSENRNFKNVISGVFSRF